jgi:tRNA (guanine37-N1)-methyltransferase
MTRIATALVHHPCLDKQGQVYTTSITNLDVHDIARSSRTYGASAFYIVTPIHAQQELARAIASFWETDPRGAKVPTRADAMRLLRVTSTLEEAIAAEEEALGQRPLVVATSAQAGEGSQPHRELRARLETTPGALIVYGTGYGLAPAAVALSDVMMGPVRGASDYNHLSVRSAAAIILDRLFSLDHR